MTNDSGETTNLPLNFGDIAWQWENAHDADDVQLYIGEPVNYDFDAEVISDRPHILETTIDSGRLPLQASYFLAPNLVALRNSFKVIAPTSDTASDGWIGNAAHCGGCTTCCQLLSDHCADCDGMVHAVDKDKDLRSPYGVDMNKVIQFILSHPADRDRLNYIIFNRVIWSASHNWEARAYTGDNPHDQHAHFSGKYENAIEANTAKWQFEQLKTTGGVTDMTPGESQRLTNTDQTLFAMGQLDNTADFVNGGVQPLPLVDLFIEVRDKVRALSTGGLDTEALANNIANKVIAATDNGLTAEDFDGIKENVKAALREGTAPSA